MLDRFGYPAAGADLRLEPRPVNLVGDLADYAVLPARRGFALWRFRDWTSSAGGWRVVSKHATREQACGELLKRFGLEEPAEPAQLPAPDEITYAWCWPYDL